MITETYLPTITFECRSRRYLLAFPTYLGARCLLSAVYLYIPLALYDPQGSALLFIIIIIIIIIIINYFDCHSVSGKLSMRSNA